ncbi:MAG: ATP-binding cassette domain-containing protein, partial [Armatimonadetes bacterium]|nr:ATP-binding cassette domain-containing protein [Armatimonadota bacterium]
MGRRRRPRGDLRQGPAPGAEPHLHREGVERAVREDHGLDQLPDLVLTTAVAEPDALLEVADLWIAFGGIQALAGVDFAVGPRTLVSVIGPNGAGKTTLFNCICGLYRPDAGTVRFRGASLLGLKPDAVARRGVARTFQNIELFRTSTVLDNVLLGRHLHFRAGLLSAALGGPLWRREEVRHRRRAEEILD